MSDKQGGGNSRRLEFPPVPDGRTSAGLDQFWADWKPVIRRTARRGLSRARVPGSLATVDDAVQHVYLRRREEWSTVDDPGRFALGAVLKPYIFEQVAELKKRSNTLAQREGDVLDQAAPGPNMEDLILEREIDRLLLDALPDALQTLPDRQRKAVEMTAAGDRSRDEIAAAMGVAAGTVSPHRTRGLKKLKERLAPIVMGLTAGAVRSLIEWLIRAIDGR